MKVLVAGWFSWEGAGATAGDVLSKDLVCEWLARAAISYDVALAPPSEGGVNWRTVDPDSYSHVVFVCGPWEDGLWENQFVSRFSRSRLIGLNLSMQKPLDVWNPFNVLIERDSSATTRPDITFLSNYPKVPLVGICLIEANPKFETEQPHALIRDFVTTREMVVIEIDTRVEGNTTGHRSPGSIESAIAATNVLMTTRLHGLVLALKNGVPAVAIDLVPGGGKISRQCRVIDWPVLLDGGGLTIDALRQAFTYCLSEDARSKARACAERARQGVQEIRDEFIAAVTAVEPVVPPQPRVHAPETRAGEPLLIEEGYRHVFNIIRFGDRYYGLAQSEGPFSIETVERGGYRQCFVSSTIDDLKDQLDRHSRSS